MFEKLLDRTPLAIIVIGTLLLTSGSAGSFPLGNSFPQISDPRWRLTLGVVGIILITFGVIWAALGPEYRKNQYGNNGHIHHDYGLKIVFPRDGESLLGGIQATGTYEIEPPESTLEVFVRSFDSLHWWPQNEVIIDRNNKTWRSNCWIGADGVIVIATVGKSGQALCNYYRKAGRENNSWPSIDLLTEDIQERGHVFVRLKRDE